jgi:hypothetical protein
MKKILTFVGLAACFFTSSFGWTQNQVKQSPTAIKKDSFSDLSKQKYECMLTEKPKLGVANQGGYVFEYESGKGADCRTYGLRNEPGKLLTPVVWKDSEETFFNTSLAECPASTECPWLVVRRISYRPDDDKTRLSWGINKDQYRESPEAFVEHRSSANLEKDFRDLITVVGGTIADGEGKPFELGIRLTSSVKEAGGRYFFSYQIASTSKSNNFQLSSLGSLPQNAFRLIWDAAQTRRFVEYLKDNQIQQLRGGEKMGVTFAADSFEIAPKLLTLFQGDKMIFATTAPAYRPKE